MSIFGRPTSTQDPQAAARYEKFNLQDNPFPSEPVVNQESTDKRLNGDLYEVEISRELREKFVDAFVRPPHSDPNHLRMCFLSDESYIGRGNGKSAFLINLQNKINHQYSLDLSSNVNKMFAITITPLPSGRTKTFQQLCDSIFDAIVRAGHLKTCLAMVWFSALNELKPDFRDVVSFKRDEEFLEFFSTPDWFDQLGIPESSLMDWLRSQPYLQSSSIFSGRSHLFSNLITSTDLIEHYSSMSIRDDQRVDFIFNDLVALLMIAGFNGGIIFVDDFERIPGFQNTRQQKDFALQIRSAFYDGYSLNARTGFFTITLVLHAGVHRLIGNAWSESGMENRAPIEPNLASSHVIQFKPMRPSDAILLVKRYLTEFRITQERDQLRPFTKEAIEDIGERSEYNAAKILKACYSLLDQAAFDSNVICIDRIYVEASKGLQFGATKSDQSLVERESVDLAEKIKQLGPIVE